METQLILFYQKPNGYYKYWRHIYYRGYGNYRKIYRKVTDEKDQRRKAGNASAQSRKNFASPQTY